MISPQELWSAANSRARQRELNASEFERRATISRLYYAVFHHIQATPIARELSMRSTFEGGMHKTLITAIKTLPDRDWQRAGRRLEDLHRRRIDADYKLTLTITHLHVDEALQAATAIRKLLGSDDGPTTYG